MAALGKTMLHSLGAKQLHGNPHGSRMDPARGTAVTASPRTRPSHDQRHEKGTATPRAKSVSKTVPKTTKAGHVWEGREPSRGSASQLRLGRCGPCSRGSHCPAGSPQLLRHGLFSRVQRTTGTRSLIPKRCKTVNSVHYGFVD